MNSKRTDKFFQLLADMLIESKIHDGQLQDQFVRQFKTYMRNHLFTPFRFLRVMDLAGGVLNFEGIEILRRCETNGQKHLRTMIPSSSSLKQVAALIESFGNIKIPFKMIRDSNDGSEGFYFRPADMTREIVMARDVVEEAKERNLLMAQTLDGATLSKKHSITMAGINFNDQSNPLTSSRNDVTPLVCIMGKEKKKNVRGKRPSVTGVMQWAMTPSRTGSAGI